MMERYFKAFADECGVTFNDLMALGHEPGAGADSPFNMAVMGLRLASLSNGVSKLHARVSQKMFSGLWPGVPEAEAPIRAVTNGVHARTWVSAEMDELLNRYVLPEWPEADETRWAHIERRQRRRGVAGQGAGPAAAGGLRPPAPAGLGAGPGRQRVRRRLDAARCSTPGS